MKNSDGTSPPETALSSFGSSQQAVSPVPVSVASAQASVIRLETIARTVEHWLKWDSEGREREGLTTDGNTHIMMLPVPVWPSHGMFRNWIAVLHDAARKIEGMTNV